MQDQGSAPGGGGTCARNTEPRVVRNGGPAPVQRPAAFVQPIIIMETDVAGESGLEAHPPRTAA